MKSLYKHIVLLKFIHFKSRLCNSVQVYLWYSYKKYWSKFFKFFSSLFFFLLVFYCLSEYVYLVFYRYFVYYQTKSVNQASWFMNTCYITYSVVFVVFCARLSAKTLPSLLSTGCFQEQIWARFHDRTRINWGPYGILTWMSNKSPC